MANWRFAYVILSMTLGGCSGTINAAPGPSDNLPAYKEIIRAALRADAKPNADKITGNFIKPITRIIPTFGPYEISIPRQMNVVGGWMWRVCLKGNDKGSAVYLAVFIKDDYVADVRTNVAIDRCGGETYEPL